MIASDSRHEHHFIALPTGKPIQAADQFFGSFVMISGTGGAANLVNDGRGAQQFAVGGVYLQEPEPGKTIMDAHGKARHTSAVLQIRIQK